MDRRPSGNDVTPSPARTPSAARLTDYVLGGKDNYAVDRQLAEGFLRDWPELAGLARASRAWVLRVVRFLAEAGVDQFLDIGCGLPTTENIHQAAQQINPAARVLYVDNDPTVLAHGRALLVENDRTDYREASAENAETVLAAADTFLDRHRPVAVLLSAVLHYVNERPADVVAPYVRWLPAGSYVAISHVAVEGTDPALLERLGRDFPLQTVRRRAEIEAAFAGLEWVEPGLVQIQRWRAEEEAQPSPQTLLGGVGRVR